MPRPWSGPRRALCLALAALAGLAAGGCAGPLVARETQRQVCIICHREREQTRTRMAGLPVWRSMGEVRDTQLSMVHDRHIAEEGKEHEHQWILGGTERQRRRWDGGQHVERSPAMEHLRTEYALSIVRDVAESDSDLAQEMYQAILSDYASGRAGRAQRLSALSQAANQARSAADPAEFWRDWWAQNRRTYGPRDRRRGGHYPRKTVTGEFDPSELFFDAR